MASDVDICNLALSRIGDSATLVSISPPEGSAQADHCARFYPMARNSLLERHSWGFATRRAQLALLANSPTSAWRYAYASPAGVANYLAVQASDAGDDYTESVYDNRYNTYPIKMGAISQQPYVVESDDSGNAIILTNIENAVLRYTVLATDTTQYSALFTDALAWLLASYLAGPVLKGGDGFSMSIKCAEAAEKLLSKAIESDANQRKLSLQHHTPDFMRARY
jgi:hypothetical protein